MRGNKFSRWIVLGLVLLCLVPELSAQRGKGKHARGKNSHAAAAKSPGKGAPGKKAGAKKPGAGAAANKGAAAKKGQDAKDAKKPDAKEQAAPAAAPMADADQVTLTADLQADADVERQRMLREHFALCDLDANDWISMREAEVTLSFGRAEFQRFDADRDGKIEIEEFNEHGDELMTRLGALPKKPEPGAKRPVTDLETLPPAAQADGADEKKALVPRPQDLLRRYDADKSKGLDAAEVGKLCAEIGLSLSTELVVEQMDPDDSGQLELSELTPLAWIAARHLPDVLRPSPLETPDAEAADGAPAAPVRNRLSHFARLDPSQDGTFDESDLRTLQSPIRLAVRLEAVVSAIDRDGDGRVSPEEFRSSMSDRP